MLSRVRRPWRRVSAVGLFALMFLLWAGPAFAHRIMVFASAEGRTIKGLVYFPGGARAKNVDVLVIGPQGKELGRTATGKDGAFEFRADFRCDHTFVVETRDGHRAEYVLRAAELPPDLPALEHAAREPAAAAAPTLDESQGRPAQPEPGREDASPPSQPPIEKVVEQVVARHVRPIRQELREHDEKVRIRDVIGAVGYILGTAGCILYFKARRVKESGGKR